MTTYESGAAVHGGFYCNPSSWTIDVVARDGARLAPARGRWVRVPAAAALVLTPILGATFLVFLPLAGFVLAARALVEAGARMFGRPAAALAGR
jgi:hypothetical protein